MKIFSSFQFCIKLFKNLNKIRLKSQIKIPIELIYLNKWV